MAGMRLEGKVHIVTGAVTAAQNIVNCIRRCGLEIDEIMLQQLASSYSVLTEDEKQLGVCMIDIGGGTTDIAVYVDGSIRHTAVIPVAGDQLTNDLAVAFRVPHQSAEAMKIKHGCAYRKFADKEHMIKLPSVGQNKEQHIAQFELAEIIEPRYEELFALVLDELQRCGWDGLLGAGVVLTGGSAKMPGVLELAEYIFQSHARLGLPRHVHGMQEVISNPSFATGIGLLLYGQEMQHGQQQPKSNMQQGVNNILGRVKTWFQGNF
jgi:cell division protein FtsA